MGKVIYIDNGASTSLDSEVLKEMQKCSLEKYENYGNAGSPHIIGENAKKILENSRKKMALELGCHGEEIIFTSGGTESNNLAILGFALGNPRKKKIIISSIEHSSVYEPCQELKRRGYEIVEIPVDKEGILDLQKLEGEINSETLLVSIIHVNNEIGVIQDLRKIGQICKQKKIFFHTDAVQSFGKIKINVKEVGIDLLSASAHKINGPKGSGLLYVREGLQIKPLLFGGKQEKGIRPGTENIPAIAGFVKALEITNKKDKNKIKSIRDYFIDEIEKIGGRINGSKEKRIYNNINFSIAGINAEDAIIELSEKGIMASSRSACIQNAENNRALKAIGLRGREIEGSFRFVIDDKISKKEVDYVIKELGKLKRNKN